MSGGYSLYSGDTLIGTVEWFGDGSYTMTLTDGTTYHAHARQVCENRLAYTLRKPKTLPAARRTVAVGTMAVDIRYR